MLVDIGQAELGRFDAAILNGPRTAFRIEGRGSFFLVEFSPL
jgi:hypothetical protein